MKDKITRRDFIKKSAVGAIAGSAALSTIKIEGLFAASGRGSYIRNAGDVTVLLSDPKNSALGKVGGSILIDDDNILIRSSETQFIALNLICKHKGCTVELQGDKFVCPCHGSEYTTAGKVTQGPSKKNLDTYETVYDSDKGSVTIKMPD